MSKKSQIKFGETFGIIFIVYILLMVGSAWYNNYSTKDIMKIQEKNSENKAFERYYYIVNSNLLHLSEQGDIDEELDYISLKVFSSYIQSNPQAKERIIRELGYATINMTLFDRNVEQIDKFNIYERRPSGNIEVNNKLSFKTLVPVVDPIEKQTRIGLLEVFVYD